MVNSISNLFALVFLLLLLPLFSRLLMSSTPVCALLPAHNVISQGRLDAVGETSLDSGRIQNALDHCGAGGTVTLSAAGTKSAFVSGPIHLKPGITLLIEKGVTLFASRDARVFQLKQGSCGIVDDKGTGCRPLLSCQDAPDARLSGEGVIDGQSGLAILGENFSWRDLAQEARLKKGMSNAPKLLDVHSCQHLDLGHLTLRNDPGALF